MATGLLSKGITLAFSTNITTPVFSTGILPDLQDIPDLGGDVDKVEVTTLADGTRRYINGLKDYGDLEFTFLYDSGVNSAWTKLTGLNGALTAWQVKLPDDVTFTFNGYPSIKLAGAGVGDPLTFTLALTVNSEIVID